ncbi:TetR/AcrR family transcriptional regulator [Nocardia transvalensis]|uniref:TetR/AcrR family transcriptional regulator n=1 Tax=Nocardia transvalensis TaxID=37333 RepID=UPI0018930696|nr:TetR/AcrR family transcriptional regulator [Nocardia transvalensis]MBF6328645.1 TetR/AcrR family transcriptional regulator [Nocardia transvalensis]
MPEPVITARQLPRGRHGLPRETVVATQRERILSAMAEVMAENGYVKTSVATIIKRARVSRETFYEQFRSKEDCFEAAYERAVELLIANMSKMTDAQQDSSVDREPVDREQRLDRVLHAYLEGVAVQPAYARLYLVEVYAVGPRAITRRAMLQQTFVNLLAEILDAHTEEQRFAVRTLVAAISAMVTARIAEEDLDGLRALREPIVEMVRRGGELYGDNIKR